jgi:hypothetical protein
MRSALPILALALVACDDKPAPAPAAASAAPAATTAAPESAAPVAPPPPELDVAAQQRATKCGADAKSGVCGVLAKMAACQAWNPIVPSGDGRWLGRGWVVEGAKTTDQFTVVRARRVPTSEVAPGQLGVRIGVGEILKQEGAPYEQADRAIRAYERADPPHQSPTVDYVKQKKDFTESFAAKTAGTQIMAQTPQGMFFCQVGRGLYMVQRASASGGDGLYGELWPISW